MEVYDFAMIMEWAEENKAICRLVEAHPQPLILDGLQQVGLLVTSVSFTLHIQGLQVNTHLGGYNVMCVAYGTEREGP